MKTHLLASLLMLGSPLLACDSSDSVPHAVPVAKSPAARPKPILSFSNAATPFGNPATSPILPGRSQPPTAARPVPPAVSGAGAVSGTGPSSLRPARPAHLFM